MAHQLDMDLFSKRLKEARTERNLTQKELSEKTGISTVMLSSYERRSTDTGRNPALNNIYAIATTLGVSIDWLCGLSDETDVNKGKSNIDTETFLHSAIRLIDNLYLYETLSDVSSSTKISATALDNIKTYFRTELPIEEDALFLEFLTDYTGVKAVIEQELLPKEMNKILIDNVIEKYKGYSINDLFFNFPFNESR